MAASSPVAAVLLFSFLLATFQAVWGASVVFVDNDKGSYLQNSLESDKVHEVFSPLDVATTTAVLLGISPSIKIDSQLSAKLNGLLSPDVFKRPHGVLALSIAGLDSSVLNNGSALSVSGFPYFHEHTLSNSESSPESSISIALSQSFTSLSSLPYTDLALSPLECSVSCSSKCIDQELEAMSPIIGGSLYFSAETSKSELTVASGDTKTVFDLSKVSDRIFASELACLFHNVKQKGSVHFDRAHDAPDLLLGILSGLQVLKDEYGYDSEKTKVAESVTVNIVMYCMDYLKEIYHGRIVSSLLFLGNTDLQELISLKGLVEKRTVRILDDSTDDDDASTLITSFLFYFTGLFLVIVTVLSVYALFSMPVTRDTLLYSSTKID